MRCKAFSVIPHLGFGNIAKFGKSNSDFRRISDTDERSQGRKFEAGRVVHISCGHTTGFCPRET